MVRKSTANVQLARLLLRTAFAFSLLFTQPSNGEDGRETDDCTSGFMSVDRMDALLGNVGSTIPSIGIVQGIYPEVNFTCSGNIQSWIFGAKWVGSTDSLYTELQIWRPGNGNGSYTKIGSTTVFMTEENTTRLYQYSLSSPLPFQAGDVLGYYQPEDSSSQLTLEFELNRQTQLGYFFHQGHSSSQLNISESDTNSRSAQILIDVITDSPGCVCGFMSVERMRYLLNLEKVSSLSSNIERRQQITPAMRFTCDGMITKWIIGADWNSGSTGDILYPEVQVWRKGGNDIYKKINGTVIKIIMNESDKIYKFDNITTIPFQAGDILGVFVPQNSQLHILSERLDSPINYYLTTGSSVPESQYDEIDLQRASSVMSQGYHPLISVEIVTTTLEVTSTTIPHPPSMVPTESSKGSLSLYIVVGVSVAVLLLIAATVIAISVIVCLNRKRTNTRMPTPKNAYGGDQSEMEMSGNVAYTATSTTGGDGMGVKDYEDMNEETPVYDYVSTTGENDIITDSNKAYGTSCDVPLSHNEAYGLMQN